LNGVRRTAVTGVGGDFRFADVPIGPVENRMLQKEDFNNDTKDAGEMGAGHSVTALYEIVSAGVAMDLPSVDPLTYQRTPAVRRNADELMTVKIRYKDPDGDASQLMTTAVKNRIGELTPRVGFASAVAEYGMLLRSSTHKGGATWQHAADLARSYLGDDPDGYRAEFVRLIQLASALGPDPATTARNR
jgi:Ca-activated chloride channel homolog